MVALRRKEVNWWMNRLIHKRKWKRGKGEFGLGEDENFSEEEEGMIWI